MKEISYVKGHTNECRKRFLDLSNEPGYEDLKQRLDKSFERATRKWLETETQSEAQSSDKRTKTQDTRSKSKQASNQDTTSNRAGQSSGSGTKRTMSKTVPEGESEITDEPEAKRTKEKALKNIHQNGKFLNLPN